MRWYSQLSPHLSLLSILTLGVVAAVVDANTWATKMINRVKNASADWEAGVQNPRRSPTASMKAAAGKWKTNMQRAITEDRWSKAVNQLTDDSIKAAAAKVGGGKFVDGITAREQKIRDAITKLQPKVAAVSSKIQGMPQDTDQQREQRMIENLRGMRGIKSS